MSNGVDFRKLALDLRGQLTDAESQLAALREELSELEDEFDTLENTNIDIKLRLADAERRNAELVELLRDTAKVLRGGECYGWEDNQADIIDAALNQKADSQ